MESAQKPFLSIFLSYCMPTKLRIIQGNITTLHVDAIVNAANSSLLGGGGVDGAIHRAAGPDLEHACRMLAGCKTGNANLTKGFRLPAKFIIHTVGPVWHGGAHQEPELLAACYQKSMEIATQCGARTVAFPSISTGIYGYPIALAAHIALKTVQTYLQNNKDLQEVLFCCFSTADRAVYDTALAALVA